MIICQILVHGDLFVYDFDRFSNNKLTSPKVRSVDLERDRHDTVNHLVFTAGGRKQHCAALYFDRAPAVCVGTHNRRRDCLRAVPVLSVLLDFDLS